MIMNNRYEEPYNKFPEDGPIPLLSKPLVVSKLSKKFWLYSQYMRNENLLKSEENLEEKEDNNSNHIDNIEENNDIEQIPEKININKSNNIQKRIRPKSNIIKGNNNRNKNIKQENINEIEQLNKLIYSLQNELNKQDYIINSQINEKMKLTKRIQELEQVLNNFC